MRIAFPAAADTTPHALVVLAGPGEALSSGAAAADTASGGQVKRAIAAARFEIGRASCRERVYLAV